MKFVRLVRPVAAAASLLCAGPQATSANTVESHVSHDDFHTTVTDWCGFPIAQHVFGSYTTRDYHDANGLLYKTIITVGPGYTQTWSANGTTLTMQSQTFVSIIYYNHDGSVRLDTTHGLDLKVHVTRQRNRAADDGDRVLQRQLRGDQVDRTE